MTKVNSLEEAMAWFLNHSSGSVICVKDGKEKEVDCYPDAVEFFGG